MGRGEKMWGRVEKTGEVRDITATPLGKTFSTILLEQHSVLLETSATPLVRALLVQSYRTYPMNLHPQLLRGLRALMSGGFGFCEDAVSLANLAFLAIYSTFSAYPQDLRPPLNTLKGDCLHSQLSELPMPEAFLRTITFINSQKTRYGLWRSAALAPSVSLYSGSEKPPTPF